MSQSTEKHDPADDVRAWAVAVIDAIHVIRGEAGPDAVLGAEKIEHGIRSARSLAIASGAVTDALLIAARNGANQREAPLTLRQLAEIFGMTHGAIDQRIKKITSEDYNPPLEDRWLRD